MGAASAEEEKTRKKLYYEVVVSQTCVKDTNGWTLRREVDLFLMKEDSLLLETDGFYKRIGVLIVEGEDYVFVPRNSHGSQMSKQESVKEFELTLKKYKVHPRFVANYPVVAKALGLESDF